VHYIRLVATAAVMAVLASLPSQAASPERLEQRAHAAELAGHLHDASMLYQAAVVAKPSRAQSYLALAQFYSRHGENHFARKYFAEALYLNPKMIPALEGAGRTDLALGDRKGAQSYLTRLQHVCGAHCPQAQELTAAMSAPQSAPKQVAAKASLDKR
jgi:tetratricopeptide (TPR) repeat protein